MEPASQGEYTVTIANGFVSLTKKAADGTILVSVHLNLPGPDSGGAAYLKDFYVLPRRNTGTREYAGEGKKALCFLINKLVSDGVLKEEDAIQLDAIASQRSPLPPIDISESTDTLKKELDPYPSLKKKAVVTTLSRKMTPGPGKGAWIPVPVENPSEDQRRGVIIPLVQTLRANRKLVAYYETYGFKVVRGKDEGTVTKMRGTIGEILNKCNPTGAARKTKTRRRRQRNRTRRHKKRGF
jgi:hypothetical protein